MNKKSFLNKFQAYQAQAKSIWSDLALNKIERVDYSNWPLYQVDPENSETSSPELVAKAQKWLDRDQSYTARLVQAGKQSLPAKINPSLEEAGLIICDFKEALISYPDLMEEALFSVIDWEKDRVAAYNLAYLQDGILVYLPKNMEIDLPIELLLLQDNYGHSPMNKRILIIADENSRLSYLERIQAEGPRANSGTLMVEVIAKPGAKIDYYAMDALGVNSHSYIRRHGQTGRDATINWAMGSMNDGNMILDTDTYLVGEGSHSNLAIIAISDGQQTQGIDSKLVNQGHYTVGNIYQHGVVLQEGILTFNGIGHILKNAKYADAQQESRVMMLSSQGRADANPILLIDEFELVAGHAASIGRVDDEELYYLMSRGLSRKTAEYLLIRGFLGSVINSMPSPEIRQEMVGLIDYKLRTF